MVLQSLVLYSTVVMYIIIFPGGLPWCSTGTEKKTVELFSLKERVQPLSPFYVARDKNTAS